MALLLAALLAACGHSVRVGGGRQLRVALTEYQLTPETARAYAGTLTITVENLGKHAHNLTVTQGSTNYATPDLAPGATATMSLDLAPGKYTLRSTVPGDQALGLWGTLNVIPIHRS